MKTLFSFLGTLGLVATAQALPVVYDSVPTGGLLFLEQCPNSSGQILKSLLRITLDSKDLRSNDPVAVKVRARVCVFMVGEVLRTADFVAFPLVPVLGTAVGRARRVNLDARDVQSLSVLMGSPLAAFVDVRRNAAYGEDEYTLTIYRATGEVMATSTLTLDGQAARKIQGYDYKTQLPIVRFGATSENVGLTSYTNRITTVGLRRAARAEPLKPCSIWNRVRSWTGASVECAP